jgi:radical SAM superfamily enzyme YgiQ (UPF0313 family)
LPSTIYLVTPPFTQLNTPYPATAYLKGFLNTKNISSYQSDLGIEVILEIFSSIGLKKIFSLCPKPDHEKWSSISENAKRIIALHDDYINTIDKTILFLQGHQPTLAHQIAKRNFLPEAGRFAQLDDLQWAFGNMGTQDKAKHIATMYLEDISDLIKECIDEHFGFSRYAERLGRSANSFDELYESLQSPSTFVDDILLELVDKRIEAIQSIMIAVSIPFPGNLYSGFRMAKFVKQKYPNIKIAMGGGFANTELRSLKDVRVFEFFDYITLDDGETPIENLIHFIKGEKQVTDLKRTLLLQDGIVTYINNSACADYKQNQVGTPDYSDLLLDKYIQAIEIVNPMHSLWSNGRWNKLTMAHGCYWGKCTFCDVSLDYIKRYEPLTASILCDRIEEMIAQTGETGFHFVDEAAPPSLMRALAIEIINRKLIISWWTNIRFEKSFTKDLCYLLKASGCIGVSGGLEVASDRLLQLINKGITVAQVAKVNRNFTEAGIMVHAYLMYGFPTQTAQETIDSLEMVRQMFQAGILQSAFWHQFAMTAHSPVGLEPEKFNVKKANEVDISFADNDVAHIDLTGTDHDSFSFGLKKSLLNYMHGVGLEEPLHKWFDMKVPRTTINGNFITDALVEAELNNYQPSSKVIFIGNLPTIEIITKSKKGNQWELASLSFETKSNSINIKVDKAQGEWFFNLLNTLKTKSFMTMQEIMEDYSKAELEDFELFWDNKPVNQLNKTGLFVF